VSTRSCRKPDVNIENLESSSKTVSMPKSSGNLLTKKGKTPKTRGKKGATRKKKIEVKSTKMQTDNSPVETALSDSEKGQDENLPKTEPIEQVFFKMEDESMETIDTQSSEAETCEIAEQFENLNVGESYIAAVQSSERTNSETINENTDENVEEVVEFDTCPEFTVEYITEEFIPACENTEVIIDEEIEGNDLLDKENFVDEKNDIDLEQTERIQQTKEKMIQEVKITGEDDKTEDKTLVEEVNNIDVEVSMERLHNKSSDEVGKTEDKIEVPEKVDESKNNEEFNIKPQNIRGKKKTQKKEGKEMKKNPSKKRSKPKQLKKELTDKTEEVRRSNRIKSINVLKQRSKGHGLVKSAKATTELDIVEATINSANESEKLSDSLALSSINDTDNKPVKVKSRWRRSSELEMNVLTPAAVVIETSGDSQKIAEANTIIQSTKQKISAVHDEEVETRLKQFVHLKENLYLTDRMACKEAKK
jgi:histone-lysine N-methyltransferase SETD2